MVSQVVVDVERTRVGIIHGREDEARLRSTGGSAVNVNVDRRGKRQPRTEHEACESTKAVASGNRA